MAISNGSASLDGVMAKIDRAEEHLTELDTELGRYMDSEPYVPVIYQKPQGRRFSVAWRVIEQPPVRLSVVAGDVLSNVRASLDYLAWELVKAAGNTPSVKQPRTQFPILKKRPKNSVIIRPGIDPAAQAVVESVQPYHEGEFANEHPLAILNELANRDKHRHLNLAVASMMNAEVYLSNPDGSVRIGGQFVPDVVHHDDVIGQFLLPVGESIPKDWNIEASGTTFVQLDEPGPWVDEPILMIVGVTLVYVKETLLPKFDGFF